MYWKMALETGPMVNSDHAEMIGFLTAVNSNYGIIKLSCLKLVTVFIYKVASSSDVNVLVSKLVFLSAVILSRV